MFRLECSEMSSKVAVVTGSSSGFGLLAVIELLGQDAKIGYFLRSVIPWNVWEGMVEKRSKIG